MSSSAPHRVVPVRTMIASVVCATIPAMALADVAAFRVIARTGDAAPGLPGTSFAGLGVPHLNDHGKVTFNASTTSPLVPTGLWATTTDNPQVLDVVVAQNFIVPGAPETVRFGQFDGSFYHPIPNNDGNIGFSAPLVGLPDGDIGVFREIDGVLETVALPGDQVPGLADGVEFVTFGNLLAFNEAGAVCFLAEFDGPGINATNDRAIFSHWFGGLSLLFRSGWEAPGLPGTFVDSLSFNGPQINDLGQIAISVSVEGQHDGWALIRGWPGLYDTVITTGDTTPFGQTVSGPIGNSWNSHQSADGALVKVFTGAPTEFCFADANGLTYVAAEGAFGPIGTYLDLDHWGGQTSESGACVFGAEFGGDGVDESNDTALIRKPLGQAPQVLAREGDHAYGFNAGVTFDSLHSPFVDETIDDADRAYFRAFVDGPGVTEDSNTGVWAVDADGDVHLMIKEGQFIEVSPGVFRQVDQVLFRSGVGTHSGRRGAVSASGAIALWVGFTDDTSAVVVAQLPPECPGDLNGDGEVDGQDLGVLLAAWGETGAIGANGDVDQDGDTDGADLGQLLSAWGPCQR